MTTTTNTSGLTMEQRQFCRKHIHTCIPAVTLTFDDGARRLHWCAEHAADAESYRDHSDQRVIPAHDGPAHLDGCPRFAAIKAACAHN